MNRTVAFPTAAAVVFVVLLGACSDDADPTTLARGDVTFVGDQPLAEQRMRIDAQEEGGDVSGEARFNEIVVTFDCVDTDTDGLVVLGGEVTTPSKDNTPAKGELMAVLVREGDPDTANVWFPDETPGSCDELLDQIPEEDRADSDRFSKVADGDDIETG